MLDNSGFELVTDLMLSYYLLKTLPYIRITLHAKQLPWFVSDALHYDVTWTLHQMSKANNEKLLKVRCDNNNKLFSSRMYTCLQHIWYKLCTIITNLLDRSSIGPRGPCLVMTSTITMINGVNVWRIIVRKKGETSKPNSIVYEIRMA